MHEMSLFRQGPLLREVKMTRRPVMGVMGQAVGPGFPAPAPTVPAAPAPAEVVRCPGPVQMPDGRVIKETDTITLEDLCEMMPLLLEQELRRMKQASGLGGLLGNFVGGGGGGFPSGGGGGAGRQGLPGPAGPPGPAGAGAAADFLTKTDGDFTAGPGAFLAVPGTLLSFTQGADGPATFILQATLSCGATQNAALGLRIDGVDVQITKRIIRTNVGGVGEFLIDQPVAWTQQFLAGPHTVEVIIRGVPGSENCGAFDFPAGISATPELPLNLTVWHR